MLIAVLTMLGLTLVLTSILVLAKKKLAVHEDPRFDAVEELLPGVNCGACGYPGCRQFAVALVREEILPSQCSVCSATERQHIADFLGIHVGQVNKVVARLACAGGSNVARFRAQYQGVATCQAAASVAGGGKGCAWGCLGFGDCEVVCDFDAIVMNRHSLPEVIENNCVACGDCVDICPKDLFSLHPVDHRLWVACKNLEFGDDILDYCEVGCTACARCARDAPDGLVTMQDNLAVVNYAKNYDTRVPIERCPTGAIVWIDTDGSVVKGREAKRIVRQQALSVGL